MSLLIGFLYLCLHIAIILIIAYGILWVVRDWMGVAIAPDGAQDRHPASSRRSRSDPAAGGLTDRVLP